MLSVQFCVCSFFPLKGGAERLFHKGELNTFQDSIALARVVSDSLEEMTLNAQSQRRSQNSASKETTSSSPQVPSPLSPPQSDPELLGRCFPPAEGDDEELILRAVRRALSLTEREAGLPGAEADALEDVFLKSAQYCDHTVNLIKLALVARSLRNLSRWLPLSGTRRLRAAWEELRSYVEVGVKKQPTCNLLLGTLAGSL